MEVFRCYQIGHFKFYQLNYKNAKKNPMWFYKINLDACRVIWRKSHATSKNHPTSQKSARTICFERKICIVYFNKITLRLLANFIFHSKLQTLLLLALSGRDPNPSSSSSIAEINSKSQFCRHSFFSLTFLRNYSSMQH